MLAAVVGFVKIPRSRAAVTIEAGVVGQNQIAALDFGRRGSEAFPHDSAPRFLIRDRDGIFGGEFRQRVKGIGIAEVLPLRNRPGRTPSPSA